LRSEIKLPDISGVSDDAKIHLKKIISDNTLDIARMERQARNFLNDFQWPEFDDWLNRFKQIAYWPYMWGSIGAYLEIQDASLSDLLNELTKDQLLRLANESAISTKKSHSKKQLLDSISKATPGPDRLKVLEIVNQEWHPRYLRDKRTVLIHSMLFRSNVKERLDRIKDPDTISIIKHIEISATDDCPICKEKSKNKLNLTSVTETDLPPFHPGCRCIEIAATKFS
jgi:hypothetical protein